MTPDCSLAENRAAVRDACEKTIRLASQRGSSTTCVQHSQDVIEDAKIMLGALDVIETQAIEIERLTGVLSASRATVDNLAEAGERMRQALLTQATFLESEASEAVLDERYGDHDEYRQRAAECRKAVGEA